VAQLSTLGDFTFMKIQRTLGTLWLALFSYGLCFWFWEFVRKSDPGANGGHAILSPIFLFGAIASIFLFRGAKWARIAIGIIALFLGVIMLWNIWQRGWMWADRWPDDSLCVISLASVVLLIIPKHEPVA
jgi:peptidoglycan/LPS O-acetylase OafA/YrhL